MIDWLTRRIGFMRDHIWAGGRFSAYLDQELDADEAARLEHHAHLCPKCHHILETLRRTIEGLHGLAAEDRPPADLADSVIERLRRRP